MEKRRISFTGLLNFRDLGGYPADGGYTAWQRFYRCDAPSSLTQADVDTLRVMGVTTVIDLRSDLELNEKPFMFKEAFDWHNVSLLSDIMKMPASMDDVSDLYFGMTKNGELFYKIFKVILAAKGAVMFHCTAGKDRTGVTAALLLLLAGVCDEDIVADYQVSRTYLEPTFAAFMTKIPADMPAFILMTHPEYMRGFLERFCTAYGTVEAYLKKIDISDAEIEALRERLIERE